MLLSRSCPADHDIHNVEVDTRSRAVASGRENITYWISSASHDSNFPCIFLTARDSNILMTDREGKVRSIISLNIKSSHNQEPILCCGLFGYSSEQHGGLGQVACFAGMATVGSDSHGGLTLDTGICMRTHLIYCFLICLTSWLERNSIADSAICCNYNRLELQSRGEQSS